VRLATDTLLPVMLIIPLYLMCDLIVTITFMKDEHFLEKCHSLRRTTDTYTSARALYYPPITTPLAENQERLGAHSDFSTITLLYQDNVGGLEVNSKAEMFHLWL